MYKPATVDAKPPRNLTIAVFLAGVTVFYYFLTSFLQEEGDEAKVIASRVPLLQTMAGCFAELIFCAVAAGPLKFIRPDLIQNGHKISTVFMVTLAGISFIQELIFYFGLRSVLPNSGLMSRIFVLPTLVFLLKTFVD